MSYGAVWFFSSLEEASVLRRRRKRRRFLYMQSPPPVTILPTCILRPDKLNLRKRKSKNGKTVRKREKKREREKKSRKQRHRVRGSHKRLIARRAASILARGNRWKKATVIYGNWDPIPINGARPPDVNERSVNVARRRRVFEMRYVRRNDSDK